MKNLSYIVPENGLQAVSPAHVDAYIKNNRPLGQEKKRLLIDTLGNILKIAGGIATPLCIAVLVARACGYYEETIPTWQQQAGIALAISIATLATGLLLILKAQHKEAKRRTYRGGIVLRIRPWMREETRCDLVWGMRCARSDSDHGGLINDPLILIGPNAENGARNEMKCLITTQKMNVPITCPIARILWHERNVGENKYLLEDTGGERAWFDAAQIFSILRQCAQKREKISLKKIERPDDERDNVVIASAATHAKEETS